MIKNTFKIIVIILFVQCNPLDCDTEITDITKYHELKSRFDPIYISHFPVSLESIPSKQMHYLPACLQGGTHLQVLVEYAYPDEYLKEARALLGKAAHAGTKKYLKDSLDINLLFKSEVGTIKSLSEYKEIVVIHAIPTGDKKFKWNHGVTAGAAFNPVQLQILYWTEDW
ncbi:MAG: hypothetical protein ACHQF2_05840 [Flavobacteriales bacterium]